MREWPEGGHSNQRMECGLVTVLQLGVIHSGQYSLPRLTEMPRYISLLQLLCSHSPSQGQAGSCDEIIHFHLYLAIFENSPFNGQLYTYLEVIALYSQEHKGNCAHAKCISSRFNKISTLLIGFVHIYGTDITMGVNG